ncbi:tetratricopeptide repeat protein [Streptomyces bauhiniae]|uniref:tetratricopeptide repeat protein n=1 Tax=Streptomyces bauhiniae TaxID=2340725 RepID=UPI00364BC622
MTTEDPTSRQHIEAAGQRSIAAGQIINAYTGDTLPAEALYAAERVTVPSGLSNLPPAGLCLGREEELTWLRRTLTRGGEGAITQGGTVHGLGGVGKSTLALHYAHRYRGDYKLIWWINASSPDSIEQSLTELTRRLVPDWAARAAREAQTAWAEQWLARHPGWLLIYDNVEDPADLSPYTGSLQGGHHLATSRRTRGWPDNAPMLPLGILDADDAADLLCALAFNGVTPTRRERAEAHSLAAELGYLPLALKQAGAYLAQNRGVTLDGYRRRLGTKLDKAADGIPAERTIARVWGITMDTLVQKDPLAVDALYTAAWLAPDNIAHGLLSSPGTDSDTLAEAIGTLAAYSMVTDTGTTISVHRLVQAVLRTPRDAEDQRCQQGRGRAEQALLRALGSVHNQDATNADRWDALIPHLLALASKAPTGHLVDPLTKAYEAAAEHLYQSAHTARAIPLLEATVAQREEVLGGTHPRTLNCRNNLAVAYETAGDLKRAIPLYEATLAQREEVLGGTHPNTLASRNNLAGAYRAAGDLERAVPLFEATLAQREEVLGGTHPDTLISRNTLAGAYRAAGDLRRAVPLYEATVIQCKEVLGDIHPHTLASRNNLAGAYRAAGDLRRAVPLYEATVIQFEEVLGDTHPRTLNCRNNLASAYQAAGDLERAIPLFEATLAHREEVLGDTHPRTLTSRNNLAGAYRVAGDLERAIPLYEATLAQREKVLGDTHPHTLISRTNLAHVREAAEALQRPDAAESMTRTSHQHPSAHPEPRGYPGGQAG